MKRFVFVLSMLLSLPTFVGCSEETPPASKPTVPAVGILTLKAQDAHYSTTYHAETAGSKAVEIRAQVSGILVSRDYEEGQFVKEGQLLFTIEPDKYRAALKQAQGAELQAKAKETQAKRDWDRIRALYAKNAVSQRDRDNALATYESAVADHFSATAAVEEAAINLDRAYVKSPIDGYASKEHHSVGNLISVGDKDSLLTVVNKVDPIYANFSIPSPSYMRMRSLWKQGRLEMNDLRAIIELADGSHYPLEGKYAFIDTSVNSTTSVVSARAVFPNPELFILPGQFVRLTSRGVILKNAVLVPQQAVTQTPQGSIVVVVDKDGKAQIRPIKLNVSFGEWFLVDSGVSAGDRVIVDGVNRANPGHPVRIDDAMTKHVAENYPLPPMKPEALKKAE